MDCIMLNRIPKLSFMSELGTYKQRGFFLYVFQNLVVCKDLNMFGCGVIHKGKQYMWFIDEKRF